MALPKDPLVWGLAHEMRSGLKTEDAYAVAERYISRARLEGVREFVAKIADLEPVVACTQADGEP